ncbi:uncharacterized protein PHACADRAFT_205710 [Phanerochaete carnosa HHB-10118-sp]|uniref:Uncharacterized protein n=1 Tax=Phanerochaete carnosa (strain HHB-10118-sp) TaxID=650164 RepID=K5W6E3_PHACS|nr:uncharacterized protein PHACADRAFT_205710 [Phanerochaete carnosa HHB-10118-sp]EKM59493.1 hypothetical protein PHACADRAFT_205710 [Phanerochaete carnosa HHB-10118-sp]
MSEPVIVHTTIAPCALVLTFALAAGLARWCRRPARAQCTRASGLFEEYVKLNAIIYETLKNSRGITGNPPHSLVDDNSRAVVSRLAPLDICHAKVQRVAANGVEYFLRLSAETVSLTTRRPSRRASAFALDTATAGTHIVRIRGTVSPRQDVRGPTRPYGLERTTSPFTVSDCAFRKGADARRADSSALAAARKTPQVAMGNVSSDMDDANFRGLIGHEDTLLASSFQNGLWGQVRIDLTWFAKLDFSP